MPSRRKVTTKKPMFGNKRSFSQRASRKKFGLNMQNKRFFVAEENKWVRVYVTADEIRTIDKIGLVEFLKRQGKTIKSVEKRWIQPVAAETTV